MNINLIKLLSKLKNASLSKQECISTPYNKLYLKVVKLLYKEGFIQSFFVKKTVSRLNTKFNIFITLRYVNNKSLFQNLNIISTPSRVNYLNIKDLSKISNKKIVLFLSTNRGLLTGLESKKYNIGGKLLFTI
jgi:small subunit ribosomal protein S8|tara:strand:- start:1851 stop:2249 length:399 start_codon:yes stop_codon:yes gene_type:complete